MSETSRPASSRPPSPAQAPPAASRLEIGVIALVVVIVLAGLWYGLSHRQQTLRSSASGLDGLQIWLASNDIGARNFSGGWPIDQTTIGLLIVPLYDTGLDENRTLPDTKKKLLLQQDEYDLTIRPLLGKARTVPALAVMPKWRSGMRLTRLAHPVLRADPERLTATLQDLTGDPAAELVLARTPFTDFDYTPAGGETLQARIYAAQMFRSDNCDPVIGTREAMLLADCPLAADAQNADETDRDNESRMLVLADPDLLNNHGLRLGDNAAVVQDLVREKAAGRNVVIDYSRTSWLRDPATQPARERTWSDLGRFFGPPFRALWVGAGLVLALALWRGALRYGPIRPDADKPGAGKMLGVNARARLMRLSGQDGALVHEYARARIAASAAALFGPAQARHYAREEAFLEFAARRHPQIAPRLRTVLESIGALPDRVTAHEAIHRIDELEQVLEQITHDA